MFYYFRVGQTYKRRDVYKMIGVDENTKGGSWDTGYNQYKGDWFVFCNIGIPGRTGHDYNNIFDGDLLVWYGKTYSKLQHPSIQSLVDPLTRVYIFARESNNEPFIYLGIGKAVLVENSVPVKVVWQFAQDTEPSPTRIAEEVVEPEKYVEGATRQVFVNVYERNLIARQKCLDYHGYDCSVCGFNFEIYGDIGKGFIHVHHLTPLAEIGHEYEVDPIKELRPVCPNCHAMLHRRRPAYTIEELRLMLGP